MKLNISKIRGKPQSRTYFLEPDLRPQSPAAGRSRVWMHCQPKGIDLDILGMAAPPLFKQSRNLLCSLAAIDRKSVV